MTVRIPYDRENSVWPWEFLMTVRIPYDRGISLWPWEFLMTMRIIFLIRFSTGKSWRICGCVLFSFPYFPFYFCFRCFVFCFRFSFSLCLSLSLVYCFRVFRFCFELLESLCALYIRIGTSKLFAAAAKGNGNEHEETHGNLFLKGRRGKGSVLLCPWTEVEGCQRGRCHS